MRQSLDQPFLGSFRILDDRQQLRALLRRDGSGFHALLMNFSLEDAWQRPIYLIRSPAARPGIHYGGAFSLQQPDGTPVGSLDLQSGLRASTVSLDRPGEEPLRAVVSAFGYDYEIQQGARTVGTVRMDPLTFPGGIHLSFPPPPSDRPARSLLVALVAFASLFHQARQSP